MVGRDQRPFEEAISLSIKSLEAIGASISNAGTNDKAQLVAPPRFYMQDASHLCIQMAGMFIAIRKKTTAKRWMVNAQEMDRVANGAGLFLCRYADVLGSSGLKDLV